MRERTTREGRSARAFDDSWPPLEKLSTDRHQRTCVACAHGVYTVASAQPCSLYNPLVQSRVVRCSARRLKQK